MPAFQSVMGKIANQYRDMQSGGLTKWGGPTAGGAVAGGKTGGIKPVKGGSKTPQSATPPSATPQYDQLLARMGYGGASPSVASLSPGGGNFTPANTMDFRSIRDLPPSTGTPGAMGSPMIRSQMPNEFDPALSAALDAEYMRANPKKTVPKRKKQTVPLRHGNQYEKGGGGGGDR